MDVLFSYHYYQVREYNQDNFCAYHQVNPVILLLHEKKKHKVVFLYETLALVPQLNASPHTFKLNDVKGLPNNIHNQF